MGTKTKIEWADRTWSPWHGCSRNSPGCDNCYAEATARRNPQTLGRWGTYRQGGTRTLNSKWESPRGWNAAAIKAGKRWTVFPSICDPFDQFDGPLSHHRGGLYAREPEPWSVFDLSEVDGETPVESLGLHTFEDARSRFFDLIASTAGGLDWILVTKRASMMQRYADRLRGPNVWLVASAENQEFYNRRALSLLGLPDGVGAVRGFSMEPLLGPVTLRAFCPKCTTLTPGLSLHCDRCGGKTRRPDWIIIGGESGPAAREFDAAWGLCLIAQAAEAGIPCFFKQFGSAPITTGQLKTFAGTGPEQRINLKFKNRKGEDFGEWPRAFRVQQWPETPAGGKPSATLFQ